MDQRHFRQQNTRFTSKGRVNANANNEQHSLWFIECRREVSLWARRSIVISARRGDFDWLQIPKTFLSVEQQHFLIIWSSHRALHVARTCDCSVRSLACCAAQKAILSVFPLHSHSGLFITSLIILLFKHFEWFRASKRPCAIAKKCSRNMYDVSRCSCVPVCPETKLLLFICVQSPNGIHCKRFRVPPSIRWMEITQ